MIKFFRHIRKSLIEKSQVGKPSSAKASAGKYLKYAIGEITLVVIGILIALQINNWNENRKQLKQQDFLFEQLLADAQAEHLFFKSRLQGLLTLDSTLTDIRRFGEDPTYDITTINTNGSGYPFLMTSFRHSSILIDNSKEIYRDLLDSDIKTTLRDYRAKYAYILSNYGRLNEALYANWKSISTKYYKELRENKRTRSTRALKIIYQDEGLQSYVDQLKNGIATVQKRTEELLQINENLIHELSEKLSND